MGEDVREKLITILQNFITLTAIELPIDIVEALKNAYEYEDSALSKVFYRAYFENIEVAKERRVPLCQDTGIPMFFLKIGTGFPYIDIVVDSIVEAVRRATLSTPLRPNAVDPFTDINSGDNTGEYVPYIYTELIPNSSDLQIYLYLAGGGSSLPGVSKVFTPGEGLKAVKKLVIETVARYGPNACPPLIVGIGIAATSEIAAVLAKKALLRAIGSRHPNRTVAQFEIEMKNTLNQLGIGVQGMGGRITVLDVFVEYGYRHPATFAAAVAIGCWAHRRGLLVIHRDLSYETPYHRGGYSG